jgi:hypothetical protein
MDLLVWALRNGGHSSKVHLYANDYWPVPETVVASFVEFSGGGYVPKTPGIPVNLGIDVTRRNVWQFPETIWTATGSSGLVVAYGYWADFLDPLTGGIRILQAQRFQAPQVFLNAGDKIRFVLTWGGAQC